RIAVGHVAGLEHALDVALGVVADTRLVDVGDPTVAAFRIGTACEALAGDDRAEKIAGAVAFSAMPGPVDHVSAAVPLRGFGRIGLELLAVEEQEFPTA